MNKIESSKLISYLLIIVVFFTQTGCVKYYSVSTDYIESSHSVVSSDKYSDYLKFVHIGEQIYQIDHMRINEEKTGLLADIIELNLSAINAYKSIEKDGKTHIIQSSLKKNQVHFYLEEFVKNGNTIAFNKNSLIETHLFKYNKTKSAVASASVITLSAIAGFTIFLAIICGCPHIYEYNNGEYERTSNAFVGAVSKVLEKEDFIAVNTLNVNINNEVKGEKQYLNEVKLIRVIHDSDVEILMDQKGNVYTIKEPILNNENNFELNNRDEISYDFTSNIGKNDLSEIEFSFPVNKTSLEGKLILSLKNTNWAGYVMNEWYKLFGEEVNKYKDRNANKVSASKQLNWQKEQGISLSVYFKKNNNWVFQNTIEVLGNTNYRDIVLPVKLDNLDSKDVEVKLVSGYKLWEIDYVAMDFSENSNVIISDFEPDEIKLNGEKVIGSHISLDDDRYQELNYSDTLNISFDEIEGYEDAKVTNFLKLKGYYNSTLDQEGELKKSELLSFKKKGQMSRFSMHLMTKNKLTLIDK